MKICNTIHTWNEKKTAFIQVIFKGENFGVTLELAFWWKPLSGGSLPTVLGPCDAYEILQHMENKFGHSSEVYVHQHLLGR